MISGRATLSALGALVLVSAGAAGYLFGLEGAAVVVGLVAAGLLAAVLVRAVPGVVERRPAPVTQEVAVHRSGPPDLRRLVGAAIAVRMVSAVVCNLTGFNGMVAPDSAAYAYYGKMLAKYWQNPAFDVRAVVGFNPRSFYQNLNAVVVYLLGIDPSLILSLSNAILGTVAAWLTSRLAYRLYGADGARRAFILVAFLPSIILWTSINLRDAWSFTILMGSLLCAQALRERFSVTRLAIMIGCFSVMPFVRAYLVPIVGLGIVASYLVVRIRRIPTALLSLAGLVGFLLVLADQFGVSFAIDLEDRLQTFEKMRNGLAYGQSAFDTSVSISTPGGALLYLPFGVANFLLSPFPWRISSWRQVMAMPETFFLYWMLYQAVGEAFRNVRTRLGDVAMVIFVTVVITCAYGLVEGNEGTAYRHRAHVLLLLAVFAGGAHARRLAQRNSDVLSRQGSPALPRMSPVRS